MNLKTLTLKQRLRLKQRIKQALKLKPAEKRKTLETIISPPDLDNLLVILKVKI